MNRRPKLVNLTDLVERIDYELYRNPAPIGDGGADDAALASYLADALPHLQRLAGLVLPNEPAAADPKALLREIVEEVSVMYAPFGGKFSDRNCKYCGQHQRDSRGPNHAKDCVWVRARAFLREGDTEDLV